MNEEKKQKSSNKWKRAKKWCLIVFIALVLIALKATFYMVGPVSGRVINAKTGEPISNIRIDYRISGDELSLPIGIGEGSYGWKKEVVTYTDDDGRFKVPFSIARRTPLIEFMDTMREIYVNGGVVSVVDNKDYDNYEHKFTWFPFRSFEFALVPTPETLEDCRDNLTEEEQYRCVKPLASRDAGEINKLKFNFDYGSMSNYFLDKYLHILTNYCANNDSSTCLAVRAFYQKDKNICNNDRYCFYSVAIDLKDKFWCKDLLSEKNIKDIYDISQEKCEYIIDALTAEEK